MFASRQCCNDEQRSFVSVCKDISGKLQQIINQAQADFKENRDLFLAQNIGKLFQIVSFYKQAFEKLNVKTKLEFENLARRYFSCLEVREVFDEIIEREKQWDDVLEDIDRTLNATAPTQIRERDYFPIESNVINARTNETDDMQEAGAGILIVSFGEKQGAEIWLEETKCPFDMVLDQDRRVWSSACMLYYVEQLLKGRQLLKPYENIHDDTQQMGGNFILASNGQVVLSYCSQVSSDRPFVDLLLASITKHTSQGKVSQGNTS